MTNIAIFIVILIVQKPKSLHFNVLNKFLRKCYFITIFYNVLKIPSQKKESAETLKLIEVKF